MYKTVVLCFQNKDLAQLFWYVPQAEIIHKETKYLDTSLFIPYFKEVCFGETISIVAPQINKSL